MIPQMRGEVISENFDKNIFSGPIKKIPANFLLRINKSTLYFIKTLSKRKLFPFLTKEWVRFSRKNICQKREIQTINAIPMEAIFNVSLQNLGQH